MATKSTTGLDPFASAAAMLAALEARQLSAVELLELHLQRIERYNPKLNAVVIPDYERARLAAAAADAARARGESGALLGLPLTVKDSIDVQGLPTICGLSSRAQIEPAPADAPLVARLRAAGVVIMGKTNTPPHTGDWQTNNRVFGRTSNPWDLSRTSGGSSGGSAAAVAAGLAPLDFGSDIAGSIRVPAAFCGVYGHKPSETALPRSGHYPGSPLPNSAAVLNVLGPLARSAEDLELALDVAAGPEVGEDVAWRLHLPPARHERLADYRVAVLPLLDWLPVDDEIVAALDRLAETLRLTGARVDVTQPEGFGDLREYVLLYAPLMRIGFVREMTRVERRKQAEDNRATGEEIDLALAQGNEADAVEYLSWLDRRERYRAAYRAFFRDWDILLAPITLVPTFPHDDTPFGERTLAVNGQMVRYMQQIVYPAVASLCGQPATAFPLGLSREGLPIGLQAIGPYLEDRTPIHFAALVAQEYGGLRPPPGYD